MLENWLGWKTPSQDAVFYYQRIVFKSVSTSHRGTEIFKCFRLLTKLPAHLSLSARRERLDELEVSAPAPEERTAPHCLLLRTCSSETLRLLLVLAFAAWLSLAAPSLEKEAKRSAWGETRGRQCSQYVPGAFTGKTRRSSLIFARGVGCKQSSCL